MHMIVTQMQVRAQNVYVFHCCTHQPVNKRCKKAADLYDRRPNYVLLTSSMP